MLLLPDELASLLANYQGNEPPFATKSAWITGVLRRQILSGELKRGEKLPEGEVANRFQCSPTPVREALRLLAAEGLVTLHPHRRPYVTDLQLAHEIDVFLVQAQLQRLAIILSRDGLTPERIATADALNKRMQDSAKQDPPQSLRAINYLFHFSLFDPSRAGWLTRIIAGLWARYPSTFHIPGRAEQSVSEHFAILDALRRGDVFDAADLMVAHHRSSARVLFGSSPLIDRI